MNDLSHLHYHTPAAQNGTEIHLPQHQPSPNHDVFPEDDNAGEFRANKDTVYNPVDELHQDHTTSVPVVDLHPNTPST